MSEITITIPLSALGDAENLSPQGILDALEKTEQLKAEKKRLQTSVNLLAQSIRTIGRNLEQTMDEAPTEMAKAQRLREIVNGCKQFQAQDETK